MATITVIMAADRSVSLSTADVGVSEENNITTLAVSVPAAYSGYSKYIEFATAAGTEVITSSLGAGATSFSYVLPKTVLSAGRLKGQIVLKSGEVVYKSRIFNLSVAEGVEAITPVTAGGQDILQNHEERLDDLEAETIVEDKHYTHNQIAASATWAVAHNLSKYPSVMIIDTAGSVVMGDIEYTDENSLQISFTAEFSGKAFLN